MSYSSDTADPQIQGKFTLFRDYTVSGYILHGTLSAVRTVITYIASVSLVIPRSFRPIESLLNAVEGPGAGDVNL